MTPLLCRLRLHRWRYHPTRSTGLSNYYPFIGCERCGKKAA